MTEPKDSDLPSPPFITIEGVANFRDVGGYAISGAPTLSIREGYLYRCADPSKATPEGLSTLRALNIKQFYDLRSHSEIEKNDPTGSYVTGQWGAPQRIFAPVFETRDYSPESLALRFSNYAEGGTEGFTRAYKDILQAGPRSFKHIFLRVANEPNDPFVVHCTAGKDRTGIICALLLAICGVDDESIAYDYSLTELGLQHLKATWVEHLIKDPALAGNRKGAENLLSAKYDNMIATLRMIREDYGGVEAYAIEKCGLSHEDIEKIRSCLITEKPPAHAVDMRAL